jgi:hypothetical protein
MIIVGVVSGTIVPSVDLLPILGKRIHIQGSNLRAQKATYQADLISRSAGLRAFLFFFFFVYWTSFSFEKEILSLITGDDGSGPIKTSIHSVCPRRL